MPTENVLIQITTLANLEGVTAAQKSFLGLSPAVLAAGIALGALVYIGKEGIANYKAQEEALLGLEQAYRTQKDTLEAHRAEVEAFLSTNAKYIANQYDVIGAMASLIRAGYSETEAMRVLNDALDWSVIKHEDVSVAATALIKVLAGNQKALRELGITTDQYNAIMKDKTLTIAQKHAAILKLVEERTAKGRQTVEDLTQSQNELNKSWQDFTTQTGPSLLLVWRKLNEAMATGLGILTLWVELYQKLSVLIHDTAGKALSSGGQVQLPGVPGRGVQVMSTQGQSTVNIHLHAPILDGPTLDNFTNQIVQRLKIMPAL